MRRSTADLALSVVVKLDAGSTPANPELGGVLGMAIMVIWVNRVRSLMLAVAEQAGVEGV